MNRPSSAWLLGALLLGVAIRAQQPSAQPPATPSPAQQEYKALIDAYGKASRELATKRREEAEAARKEGKPAPALSMAGPAAEWLPKFRDGAEKYKGTDDAIPFLVWIGGQTRDAERDAVLATLLTVHLKSKEIGSALRLITSQLQAGAARLVNMQTGQPAGAGDDGKAAERETRVREQLARIIAENPHPDVKAQTLLARANIVLTARTVDEAKKPAAIEDVRAAAKVAVDSALLAQLTGILYEQDHLAIGMTAPDIEGPDLDGVAFKLSDYRGKVVLLDYWGYW